VASSGMEAPHLKQNIQTHPASAPANSYLLIEILDSAVEKYLIQIEKAIISIAQGITFVMRQNTIGQLFEAFECRFGGKVSAHTMYARCRWC
jgi:hypothetical protein